MGWLDRLFGHHESQPAAEGQGIPTATIPPERVGLNGEYDQSGLAKRVAKAFDDAGFDDHQTVWIAQHGSVVVLKGKAPSQEILTKMVSIAKGINGATAVETDQVTIG
jgi:osmotically-inducible protein OsmY